MKSEPSEFSIDDLVSAKGQTTGWFGVRNYQARNFMRDEMRLGDMGFFYHSSCPEPGIAGLVTVCNEAYPDPTQFDSSSDYFDPKSNEEAPRWVQVDVRLIRKTKLLSLAVMRVHPGLQTLRILQKGNRLSITPVTEEEAAVLNELLT